MKAKAAIAIVLLAIAAISVYALAHQPKPASATVTPQPSASAVRTNSAGPAKSDTTTAATALIQCTTSDLALSVESAGGGTAGTTYRHAVLTNQSTHACTLGGFPGVSLVDADDQQLGQPAKRTGPAGPTVTLAPGKAAASAIGFPNPANFPGGTCTEQSFNLKLYPPGQTTALESELSAQACPGFSVQSLQPAF